MLRSTVAFAQTNSLVDLGAGVTTYGINASGQITGCMPVGGDVHAFLYTAGSFLDLGTLAGGNSCGYALNGSGQVTGYSAASGDATHAFLYSGGTMRDLDTGSGYATVGTSINASGAITGYASQNGTVAIPPINGFALAGSFSGFDSTGTAFLYQNGVMSTIASRPAGQGSDLGAVINDSGTIAGLDIPGTCSFLCPVAYTFLYLNGTVSDLANSADFISVPTAINNAGQVIGFGEDANANNHGLIFQNGGVTDLGNDTEAYGINDLGQIVGASNIGLYSAVGPDAVGFVYDNGQMTPLNMPGAVPVGINDSGWIIANSNSNQHAYLLRPSEVSFTPTGLTFASTTVGSTSATTGGCGDCSVTLTNNGSTTIAVSAATVTGPFTLTNDTCGATLAVGSACTLSLSFAPTAIDTTVASVSLTAGGTTYVSLLSGVGTLAVSLSASATSVSAGAPFTLTWNATSGASCASTGGALAYNNASEDGWQQSPRPVSGSATLTESTPATLTFTFTCTDGSQTQSATAQVTVLSTHHGGGGALDETVILCLAALWQISKARASLLARH